MHYQFRYYWHVICCLSSIHSVNESWICGPWLRTFLCTLYFTNQAVKN